MKVTVKTEDELSKFDLLEPGVYDFEVMQAEEKVSKSGNDMIALKLRVFCDGGERHIYDYLLDSVAFKVKHFADAVGLQKEYETGSLMAIDCLGRAGKVKIGIQRDKEGTYPDRNTVKDYFVQDSVSRIASENSKPGKVKLAPEDTSDIPF